MAIRWPCWPLLLVLLAGGCPEEIPRPTDAAADLLHDGRRELGDGASCSISWDLSSSQGQLPACPPGSADYQPGSSSDGWPPCISDDGLYHPLDPSISSIARVAAFEEIRRLLLVDAPAAQRFIEAKLAYTQPEGLDSRVSRREDEHYPAPARKCADLSAAELQQNADRCVGQARIQPLLNQAFLEGASGQQPLVNAARIESALLWFLYLSIYKEGLTCAAAARDCDSSYAYYTGGEPRTGGKGLAGYLRSLSLAGHDRVWDGLLALRCWRELDPAVPAANLILRDRALAQLDRALLRGLALITRARAEAASRTCGAPRAALWASTQILAQALDREAMARAAAPAQRLRDLTALVSPGDAELDEVVAVLEQIFGCP